MALVKLYDASNKYRQQLHNELTLAQSGKKASKQLVTMAAANHLRASADVLNHGSGKDKLLVYGGKDDAVAEEMVLSIQGYLLKTKLPPITKESDIAQTKVVHTEQYVRIGGLADPLFDQGAVAVLAIHQFLESRLGSGSLQDMDVKQEQGHIVLDFHNRYLTPRSEAAVTSIIPFPNDYDPRHILQSRVTDEVFTTNNAVQFYERVKLDGSSRSKYQFKKSHPTALSVGQLVEIQTSFAVVPRGKKKYMLINKLRSICVLDQSIENEINQERIQAALRKTSPTRKVKRNVGYEDDDSEVEEAREDVKCMRISRSESP
ncbi:uncharacterized protein C8Q71DRAFT_863579 [Rhodofomes roseus]|uniref:Uncharacterized protein n=1 Tax=Rhodofomes roseus TaxID=34475 RepID=A0ABQ8JXS6_9APHY|nr:uncharacterized protein C8Q71DRAFT_863579 [Rhodofomes roseus]KAH9829028.1 hypothetical protein C8Q71DRAFT_863579 [Rhodofomes roseus]